MSAFFFVGISSNFAEYEAALLEEKKFKDIVLYEGGDFWENLSRKVFAMIVHAQNTFEFEYFLKTDDDTFVDVLKLLELTDSLPEKRVYWGWTTRGNSANSRGRWQNAEFIEKMGHNKFSPYQSGAGYLISSDILNYLRTAEEQVGLRYFSSEDVTMG
eukprot:220708_1